MIEAVTTALLCVGWAALMGLDSIAAHRRRRP